jgi:hypothetical protein
MVDLPEPVGPVIAKMPELEIGSSSKLIEQDERLSAEIDEAKSSLEEVAASERERPLICGNGFRRFYFRLDWRIPNTKGLEPSKLPHSSIC